MTTIREALEKSDIDEIARTDARAKADQHQKQADRPWQYETKSGWIERYTAINRLQLTEAASIFEAAGWKITKPSAAPVGDIAGLIARLRAPSKLYNRGPDYEPITIEAGPLREEAAKALSRMEEREKELCEGLKPFAKAAKYFDGSGWRYADDGTLLHRTQRLKELTVGHLRRARNLLAGKETGE